MKNKLQDLTNHLFVALERVNEEHSDPDELRDNLASAGAVVGIAREIIAVGRLAIDAQKVLHELGPDAKAPALLGLDKPL